MLMASQNNSHNNIVIIKIPLSKGRQYNFLTLGSDNHITTPLCTFQINLFCQENFPLWKFGRGCEWDILKGPVSHNWQLVFKLTLLFFVLMVVF